MNNILREISWAVLMVCLPIATACVKKAAASIGASAEENAKSEVTRRLVQEIANAVADAVAAMNQSYVDDLKKAGTFKEEEQAQRVVKIVFVSLIILALIMLIAYSFFG